MNKFRVSEIFYSPQGEGKFTGQLSVWVRFFSCNLQCAGFSQKDPTDPATYILPHLDFDSKSVTNINDLPVFPYGCDTSYSWSSKYKHLCPYMTAAEIGDKLVDLLPYNSFYNPFAVNDVHLVFTGGEPLLPKGQQMIIEVLDYLDSKKAEFAKHRPNKPLNVTIETNGSQVLSQDFKLAMSRHHDVKFFFSISPKLFNVSGENRDKAMNVEAMKAFSALRTIDSAQLKFVVNNNQKSWNELEEIINLWRSNGVYAPVWIMPLGATVEQQESDEMLQVVEEAMRRGYNISARTHVYIFGNKVGF